MTAAGLTMDDWDDFYDVMTDEYESENVKENYNCWMLNYLTGCSLCTPCRGPDPFD